MSDESSELIFSCESKYEIREEDDMLIITISGRFDDKTKNKLMAELTSKYQRDDFKKFAIDLKKKELFMTIYIPLG